MPVPAPASAPAPAPAPAADKKRRRGARGDGAATVLESAGGSADAPGASSAVSTSLFAVAPGSSPESDAVLRSFIFGPPETEADSAAPAADRALAATAGGGPPREWLSHSAYLALGIIDAHVPFVQTVAAQTVAAQTAAVGGRARRPDTALVSEESRPVHAAVPTSAATPAPPPAFTADDVPPMRIADLSASEPLPAPPAVTATPTTQIARAPAAPAVSPAAAAAAILSAEIATQLPLFPITAAARAAASARSEADRALLESSGIVYPRASALEQLQDFASSVAEERAKSDEFTKTLCEALTGGLIRPAS